MDRIDELKLNLISDADIEKLERIKSLLAEIRELKNEVFGKQTENTEKVDGVALRCGIYFCAAIQNCFKESNVDGEKQFAD